MMADGGNTLRAIDVLRHQSDLLGEVASPATLCRTLGDIDAACLTDLDAARARVRQRVWDLIVARHGRIPAAEVPSGDLGEQRAGRSRWTAPASSPPPGDPDPQLPHD